MDRFPIAGDAMQWGSAFGAFSLALLVMVVARRQVRRAFGRMASTDATEFLELPAHVFSRTSLVAMLVVSLVIGLQFLDVRPRVERLASAALTIAGFWQAGLWSTAAALTLLDHKRRTSVAADRELIGSLGIIGFVARVLIWSVVVLLMLDNLGVDITALVAGLGIGGIAVALAVQNVLGDLLASLSITFDKPFIVGDFLAVGDFLGSVEYIGIKSTRLRSLSGEQIVISNADLLSSRLRNFGRMAQRRIQFTIGVAYETPVDTLERLPALIRRIVEAEEQTRFDRSHFARFAAASLDVETVYFVLSADYNVYMDIQQRINFAIMRELESLGVEFAYPTQKLWLARVPTRRDLGPGLDAGCAWSADGAAAGA
ncbi:MAG: mechanosensitive ion channel family protein [Steroidobacteraceae bacterium]|nr:mechanosensitive ion channel family protein [Steroidobacteraceae bacterium]